jgi:hypothetical protein
LRSRSDPSASPSEIQQVCDVPVTQEYALWFVTDDD